MSVVESTTQPAPAPPLHEIPAISPRYQQLLIALVIGLYLAVVSPHWFITSDSALYLMLGENLAAGNGYSLFGRPHAHVPPGFPLLVAALTYIGLGGMFWLNLSMTLVGLGTLWLSYKLLREHVAASAAVLIALVLAFTWDMYSHSAMQLSEVPFMLLVTAGLLGYAKGLKGAKGWMELGSVCLLACCWVRVIGAPLVVGAAFGLVLQGGRAQWKRTLANACGVAVGLGLTAALFYAQHQYAKQTYNAESYAVAFEALRLLPTESRILTPVDHTYVTGAHLFKLFTGQPAHPLVGWFAPGLPLLVGLGLSVWRRQWMPSMAVSGYVTALLLLNPAISRYLLPIAPLLLLFYFDGASNILRLLPRLAPYRGNLVAGFAIAIVLINAPKDIRLIYRMHVLHTGYELELRAAMLEVAEFVEQHARPGEKFVSTDSQREIAYLSHVPFLETSDSAAVEQLIAAEGVRLVVVGPDRRHSWRYPQLRAMVQDPTRFTPIYKNELYQVYEVQPIADRTAAVQGEAKALQ